MQAYDPQTKRWTQPDPSGLDEGMDLYRFSLNNPVNCLDIYGGWNLWNPATWGVANAVNWSIIKSLNPVDNDTASWDAFTWHEVEKGAASTLDGIIPFADPFEIAYTEENGCLLDEYKWSREIAAFSRDLYLFARIPNVTDWLKNPKYYEKGSKMVPNKLWETTLKNKSVVERGKWLYENAKVLKTYSLYERYIRPLPRVLNSGLTPKGRASVLLLGGYTDYLYRKNRTNAVRQWKEFKKSYWQLMDRYYY